MIHQLIFASPKPGMSEKDFQDYWLNVHAVQYASKISQIKKYLIDTRIPFFGGDLDANPRFSGVAEIWLNNSEEQLESLQSPEFIEGARADEPNWAAFWATVGLDTDTHELLEGPQKSQMVKLFTMMKRKEGIPLKTFREYSLNIHGPLALKLPGLRRYCQCHVRDSFYAIGEALLDCVALFWFDDTDALQAALNSPENAEATKDLENFVEMKYLYSLVGKENWIIGPEPRP